jgi:hypothetical protein
MFDLKVAVELRFYEVEAVLVGTMDMRNKLLYDYLL